MMVSRDNSTAGLVRSIMLDTDFGLITNIFVVAALRWYAGEVLTPDSAVLRAFKAGTGQLISCEDWVGVAKEVLEKLDAQQYRH